jgi:hypothetical protein
VLLDSSLHFSPAKLIPAAMAAGMPQMTLIRNPTVTFATLRTMMSVGRADGKNRSEHLVDIFGLCAYKESTHFVLKGLQRKLPGAKVLHVKG